MEPSKQQRNIELHLKCERLIRENRELSLTVSQLRDRMERLTKALEGMEAAADALRMHVPGYHENDDKHDRVHAAFAKHAEAKKQARAALQEAGAEDTPTGDGIDESEIDPMQCIEALEVAQEDAKREAVIEAAEEYKTSYDDLPGRGADHTLKANRRHTAAQQRLIKAVAALKVQEGER